MCRLLVAHCVLAKVHARAQADRSGLGKKLCAAALVMKVLLHARFSRHVGKGVMRFCAYGVLISGKAKERY